MRWHRKGKQPCVGSSIRMRAIKFYRTVLCKGGDLERCILSYSLKKASFTGRWGMYVEPLLPSRKPQCRILRFKSKARLSSAVNSSLKKQLLACCLALIEIECLMIGCRLTEYLVIIMAFHIMVLLTRESINSELSDTPSHKIGRAQ